VTRIPRRDNSPVELVHHPAIAWVLLFVVVGGVVMALGNLRNVSVWLLQVTGKRAEGVVEAMEFVSGENNEPMRRPVVAFTTDRGRRVVGRPALYRKSTTLAKGMTVPVRYSAGNPERMVVPGFGFRYREPVFAAIGATTAIVVSAVYFFT
jgi:hypothetical protein